MIAGSSSDPDLAPFVGAAHLGECFVIQGIDGGPWLGYLTAMERQEAAATGCRLLGPEVLDLDSLRRQHNAPAALWAAILSRALSLSGIEPGRLALAGHAPAGTVAGACAVLAAGGWEIVSGHPLVRALRKVKSAEEIEAVRRAAAGTVEAFRRVAELLAAARVSSTSAPGSGVPGSGVPGPGEGGRELWLEGERLRVGRLRREIALALAVHGLGEPEGNIVAAGGAGAVPHTQGDSQRVLRTGESLVVDLFPRGRLFADCTRTFCVGQPPEGLVRAHHQVRDALEAAAADSRPGTTGWELQEATCTRLAAAGYATPLTDPGTVSGYVHGLGHGVGYELHELPSFRRGAEVQGVLEVGDVFTLEPGLYLPEEQIGVRIENLYVLAADGPECLTPLPFDLDPRAWGG